MHKTQSINQLINHRVFLEKIGKKTSDIGSTTKKTVINLYILLYISLIKRLLKNIFVLNSIQIVKFSLNYTVLDILSDHESVNINRERSLCKLSCLID